MKNLKRYIFFTSVFALSVIFTSCFQSHSDDCNYRTVPTTNNPNYIPNNQGPQTIAL